MNRFEWLTFVLRLVKLLGETFLKVKAKFKS